MEEEYSRGLVVVLSLRREQQTHARPVLRRVASASLPEGLARHVPECFEGGCRPTRDLWEGRGHGESP